MISNAPSVVSVRVECSVSRVEPGGVGQFGGGDVVGTGFAVVPVSGGNYSGTPTVEVSATGIITPDQARSYVCQLTANGRARTGAAYSASSGNMQAAYETATGTTLTSFRSTVGGPIPR
jgi:hypothetical protein